MSKSTDFSAVFDQLKTILAGHANHLSCITDEADHYYLDTPHIMKSKLPLFFGSVRIRKSYVSFHLMPVYVFPELLENLSPALKKRMQGKSCFNFKTPDPALFAELSALTRAGYQRYREAGYVH